MKKQVEGEKLSTKLSRERSGSAHFGMSEYNISQFDKKPKHLLVVFISVLAIPGVTRQTEPN